MSLLTKERTRPSRATGTAAPRLPQVNLLPAEVRQARQFSTVRRYLVLALVAAVVAGAGLIGFGMLTASQARSTLANEEARTQTLLAEQAKYAEVPLVYGTRDDTLRAREIGMVTDVAWGRYLLALGAALPEGVSLTTVTVEAAGPLQGFTTSADPLLRPGVARLTFGTRSEVVPQTADWLTALEKVPGLYGVTFQASTLAEKEGSVFYETAATAEVDLRAYSQRFWPDEAKAALSALTAPTEGADQ